MVLSPPDSADKASELDPVGLMTQLALATARIQHLEALLEEQGRKDTLTGLPDRPRLLDRTEQAIALARRHERSVAMLFVEVDRFKSVDRSLEFAQADELWLQFSRRLATPLRRGDTLARLAPDQFAILLPEVRDPLEPCRVAQDLLGALGIPFRVGPRELALTASIGISLCPQDGEEAALLLKHAEMAAGRSRAAGGGVFHCSTPTLSEASLERRELETGLGNALAKGEMHLLFQPQCALDGTIVGLEALVRWRHPALGLVLPSKFIPLAEESQLIHTIGEWVLRTACRRMAFWRTLHSRPLRLAVNVSPLQIGHPQWVDTVARVLRDSPLPPRTLEFEITEGTLLRHAEPSSEALQAIKAMGVRIGIDDFGTGYSSLVYLHQLPIDTLKIDLSFVSGLRPEHPDVSSVPIVQSILDLGHNLRLDVVAEGVETALQKETLHHLGCRIFQGFHLGVPMAADEVEAALEAQQARIFDRLLAGGAGPTRWAACPESCG